MRVSVRGGGGRRRAFGPLLAAGIFAIAGMAVPSVVHAADANLAYYSSATYNLAPNKRMVHAVANVTATGSGQDVAGSRSFYDGATLSIPPSTTNIAAFAGTKPLPLKIVSATSSETAVAVGFGHRIYTGQSASFKLQFDIADTGSAPERDIRITHSLSSFPVFAIGSGVQGSSVTVQFPAGYNVTEDAGDLQRQDPPAGQTGTIYTSLPEAAGPIFAWFTAETTPQSVLSEERIGPLSVKIVSWEDDPGWASQVEHLVRDGYPILRDEIGLGDVPPGPLTIQETPPSELRDVAGQYDMGSGTILLGFDADPSTLLHEIAHLWFNSQLVSDRWIDEGFASYYAERALAEMNVQGRPPSLNDRKIAARMPLASWTPTAGPPTVQDEFVYAASLQVARQIVDVGSDNGLRRVWKRIASGPEPYAVGLSPAAKHGPPPDSRQLLDYLEDVTGTSFDDIWAEWVLPTDQAATLQQRARLRAEYFRALTEAGTWQMPLDVRASLRSWDFGSAETQLDAIQNVLVARDSIEGAATAESVVPPPTLQTAFETSVPAAVREADGEISALNALAAARQAQNRDGGTTQVVGLIGAKPAETLAEARAAFTRGDWADSVRLADSARSIWEGAANAGRTRVLTVVAAVSGVLLLLVLALLLLLSYRARRTREARAALADAASIVSAIPERASQRIASGYAKLSGAPPGEPAGVVTRSSEGRDGDP